MGGFGKRLESVLQVYDRIGLDHRDTIRFVPEEQRLKDIYRRCVKGNLIDISLPLKAVRKTRAACMNEKGEVVSRLGTFTGDLPNFPFS